MSQLKIVINVIVGLLTIVFAFGAVNTYASDTQNSITGVNANNAGNGTIILKVDLAQPLASVPNGFTINTPPRIAFDFTNSTNGLGKVAQDFNEGDLRSVNLIQAGNRTRLVVNLNQMVTYETKIDGSSLLVTLHTKVASLAEPAGGAQFAAAKTGEQTHALRDIDFHRGKNGEGRVQVDLSDSVTGIDIRQQGSKLIVDYIKTSLPHNLQRKLDVSDFSTPVQTVDTFVKGDSVQMVIEPKGLWEYAAYQTDNKFIIEVKPVVEDPNKLVKSSQTGYAGEKLTLDFQSIAVREALNVIADFTNLNVVISDTVTGNLTLRLKDVPWDQALDIILQSRGLDMRKNGNVIQVAPREELAAKEKIDLTARQEISDLEEVRTETFQLNYIKGDALKKIVTDPQQKLLSKRGSAVWDERTNMMFIQDTPSKLDEVRKIIAKVDVPVRQVMIEARVVEASDLFSRNLGVNMTYNNSNIPTSVQAPPGVVGSAGGAGISAAGVTAPSGGALGTITAVLFNASNTRMLNLQLQALDADSKGKIISSPRVVMADKTEATIETGVQIPYQQASSSGATTTSFVTAALSLKVKPLITPDDKVELNVQVNKDSVGQIYNSIPSINTNKVSTQVLVENGGTVVIGGVYTQSQTESANKVPWLGDIPILGYLFKSIGNIDNKNELLVFITPKIMKDSVSLK